MVRRNLSCGCDALDNVIARGYRGSPVVEHRLEAATDDDGIADCGFI
jgi:hypothetical protein